jgi:hypothetical protein
MHTIDGGNAWTTVASVTNLTAPISPGSLPYGYVTALAAGSAGHLRLAWMHGLAESSDSGATWTEVSGVDPNAPFASFDVQSPRTAWLLAPGAGLWTTNDDVHWNALGPGCNTLSRTAGSDCIGRSRTCHFPVAPTVIFSSFYSRRGQRSETASRS